MHILEPPKKRTLASEERNEKQTLTRLHKTCYISTDEISRDGNVYPPRGEMHKLRRRNAQTENVPCQRFELSAKVAEDDPLP